MEYKKHDYDEFFGTGTKQKILEFFRENKEGRFTTQEISNKLATPESSVNRALNDLMTLGLLEAATEGKFKYFQMVPSVRQWFDRIFNYLDMVRRYTLDQRKGK